MIDNGYELVDHAGNLVLRVWPATVQMQRRPRSLDDIDIEGLVTPSEAALLAGVDVSTIRKWRERGKIKPQAFDQYRRPLYLLIDIAKAEAATRLTGKAHR